MDVLELMVSALTIITAIYVSYKVYRTYFYKQITPLMVIPITFIIIESFFILSILELPYNTELEILLTLAVSILIFANISIFPFILFDILSIFKIQTIFGISKKIIIPVLTIIIFILLIVGSRVLFSPLLILLSIDNWIMDLYNWIMRFV